MCMQSIFSGADSKECLSLKPLLSPDASYVKTNRQHIRKYNKHKLKTVNKEIQSFTSVYNVFHTHTQS